MATPYCVAFSTCPTESSAKDIARALIERGLAACVNIVPGITSVYKWQGNICEDREFLLMIKTTTDRTTELESVLQSLHPYELPELIVVPVEGGLPAYLDWVKTNTSGTLE